MVARKNGKVPAGLAMINGKLQEFVCNVKAAKGKDQLW